MLNVCDKTFKSDNELEKIQVRTERHFSITLGQWCDSKNKGTKSHAYFTQHQVPMPTIYATERMGIGNTANSWKIQRLKAECNRGTGLGCILKQHCSRLDA